MIIMSIKKLLFFLSTPSNEFPFGIPATEINAYACKLDGFFGASSALLKQILKTICLAKIKCELNFIAILQ